MDKAKLQEKLEVILYNELSDAYDCTRAWSAWSYGTMSERDFYPVEDRITDIASSIMEGLFNENED